MVDVGCAFCRVARLGPAPRSGRGRRRSGPRLPAPPDAACEAHEPLRLAYWHAYLWNRRVLGDLDGAQMAHTEVHNPGPERTPSDHEQTLDQHNRW